MLIGGLQKLTLIDYSGKVACTVFTVGCNFRCPFCHNPELSDLRNFKPESVINEESFFSFLLGRQGILDGVCITGGEPTLNPDLPEFIRQIKKMDFSVKLDTNGTNPEMLAELLEKKLVDYVAMDIKAPLEIPGAYDKAAGVTVNMENIRESLKIIIGGRLDYELRTTVVPGLHTEEDILSIARTIRGAKKYYLQKFRPGEKIMSEKFKSQKPYSDQFLKDIRDKIKDFFGICEVRD